MNYSSKNKSLPRGAKRSGGFTLLELIVVVAIASIMMTTLVVQQSQWNDSLIVTTQAYEMALEIRQAQIYSLAVREDVGNPSSTADKFSVGYGVHFDQDHMNRYVFFADRDNDKKYDAGEEIEIKGFTRGVTIKDVCGTGSNGCFPGSGPLASVDILFLRPETKANIKLLNNGGDSTGDPPVTIRLQSPGGKFSSVKVESNGQVSIQ